MQGADEQVVAALGRVGVRSLAPAELPLFSQLSGEYFARGVRLDRSDRDTLLGFGVDAAVVLLTPVVLEACHQLFGALSAKAAEVTAEGAKSLLGRLRARLAKSEESNAQVEFTPQELALVRAETTRCAADLQLSESQQRLLANAIVGALASPAHAAEA